ncbi:MAG: hypothetical protein JWO21_418 [Solirubrobacterales bacterium]|nr:hypothetical protein [Solirubrobacterales bacterium]
MAFAPKPLKRAAKDTRPDENQPQGRTGRGEQNQPDEHQRRRIPEPLLRQAHDLQRTCRVRHHQRLDQRRN